MTAAFQSTLPDPLGLWQPLPKADAEADVETDAEADVETDAEADAETDVEADAEADVETDAKADVEADAEADAETDAEADVETDAAVSFGLPQGGAARPNAPVFRLCLDARDAPPPADWAPLERALSEELPSQFETLLQKIEACQRAGAPVSFAAAEPGLEREPASQALREAFHRASQEAQPGPERELFSLLAEVVPAEELHFSAEAAPLEAREPLSRAWRQARDEFTAFLERINQTVLHFAWVETVLGGRLLARSAVDWNGDAVTAWDETAGPEQQRAHQQALERIARTRHLNLRLLALVLGGAARVAALLTAGTPVLAAPLVYRYVMAVLRQMKVLQSAS